MPWKDILKTSCLKVVLLGAREIKIKENHNNLVEFCDQIAS